MKYYKECPESEAGFISAERDDLTNSFVRLDADIIIPHDPIKIIDLSGIAGSDVLMESSNLGEVWGIFKLKGDGGAFPPYYRFWGGWQAWLGDGVNPLPDGVEYDVMRRDGQRGKNKRYPWVWSGRPVYEPRDNDIVAYRVTGLSAGYKYKWEVEQ